MSNVLQLEMEARASSCHWTAGIADVTLSEDVLCSLARTAIFTALDGVPRWRPARFQSLCHNPPCTCRASVVVTEAVIATFDASPLHRMLLRVVSHDWVLRSTGIPRCVLRTHRLACGCGATLAQQSVHVTVPWAGRKLSREYAV